MKLSFRWFGKDDPVTLKKIRQIPGMRSVVSAVYDVSVGEVWSDKSIAEVKSEIESHGLVFDVVESVPVHEDIKLGKPSRDRLISNYNENIRRLAKAGVKCICYNFMPVFDWTRTELYRRLPDGSSALVYYKEQLSKMDPLVGELSLPGWDRSYKKEDLKKLFEEYRFVDEEKLWGNLEYFLKAIIPVAEENDVLMAIHPDDPPYSIFGLPRIITNETNIDRLLKIVDSKYNGLTFCTGSLGSTNSNDVVAMIRKYAEMGRIHFMHIRNIKLMENDSFEESSHLTADGTLNMAGIAKALVDNDFDGYVRPDHGRMIWDEVGRPGYGLYDRALGAAYINGLFEAFESIK